MSASARCWRPRAITPPDRRPNRRKVAAIRSLAARPGNAYISREMADLSITRRAFTAALTACLFGRPALAAQAAGKQISAADQTDVHRVEDYLNSVKTLKARFLQVDSRG